MTLPERDAVLAHALRHAPEPAQPPSEAVWNAVLAHATKSIAASPYTTNANSPKTPQKQSLSAWQRLLNAIGLSNVGPTRLAGVMASLFVAVLVGVLWQDDGRRQEASATGQVAATAPAALPAPAPRPASPPVPAAQDKLRQRESESQRNSQVLAEIAAPSPSPTPAPVVAAAPTSNTASNTGSNTASDAASALSSTLEQLRVQGGLQCTSDKPCNTSPLQALLRSPLMRQAMARAQPDAGNTPTEPSNTVRTLRTVQWQALGDARAYSLAWNVSTSTLHWRSPHGAFVVQLPPQDAAAMQEWFDAVQRP